MPDREKLNRVNRAWECCNPFNRKCNECPYEKDCYHDGISRHMVADAVALLNEQPEIVRCKDCKHRGNSEKCVLSAISKEKDFPLFMLDNRGEWFCADGERQEGR